MSEVAGLPLEGRGRRAWVLLAWGVVWSLAALGGLWLARSVDWPGVGEAVRAANPAWLSAAFAAQLLGLPLWTLAWRGMLPKDRRPGFGRLMEAQAVTMAAIQVLSPLGGGATAMALLTRRVGMSAAAVLSVLTLDQMMGGVAKLIIIGAATLWAPAPTAMRGAGLGLLAIVLGLLATITLAARYGRHGAGEAARGRWRRRALDFASAFASQLAGLRSPARFCAVVALYLARRSMEAAAALCVQQACGVAASGEAALLAVAALSLSTVIPGPPGNLGVYEAAVALAYGLCGVAPGLAVAMALLQHAAFLASAILPGCAALAWRWTRPTAPISS